MVKGQDLAVSLEEFGLSKYEAQAYVTLITKGTISAAELAYYSDLPRTKVYPTLLKLEKKKIAIISKSKPIMCTAIAPEDAFDEIIQEQINRVNAMNSLTSKLKQLSEDSKKARGSEEKRYFHLSQNYVFRQLQTMIEGSKKSIHAVVDSWGLGLLSQCKDEMLVALRRDIDVRLIIPPNIVGTEAFRELPAGIKLKTSEVSQNVVTFDDSEILMINSSNGKGAIFLSTDVLGTNQVKSFDQIWKNGIKISNLADMTKSEAQETLKIIQTINENGLGYVLNSVLHSRSKGIDILNFLEKNGIDLQSKTLNDVIALVDSTLDITCSGHLKYESHGNNFVIESKVNSGHSIPWALVLEGYLNKKGIKTKLIYSDHQQTGEKIHIKIDSKKSIS